MVQNECDSVAPQREREEPKEPRSISSGSRLTKGAQMVSYVQADCLRTTCPRGRSLPPNFTKVRTRLVRGMPRSGQNPACSYETKADRRCSEIHQEEESSVSLSPLTWRGCGEEKNKRNTDPFRQLGDERRLSSHNKRTTDRLR